MGTETANSNSQLNIINDDERAVVDTMAEQQERGTKNWYVQTIPVRAVQYTGGVVLGALVVGAAYLAVTKFLEE